MSNLLGPAASIKERGPDPGFSRKSFLEGTFGKTADPKLGEATRNTGQFLFAESNLTSILTLDLISQTSLPHGPPDHTLTAAQRK